jgi:hypothetical protein
MVIMFSTNAGDVTGKILLVQPQSDLIGSPGFLKYYKYWAPSTLNWHPANDVSPQPPPPLPPISFPPSIHQFSYLVSYTRTDDWVQKHPKQAIAELLEKGHEEQPLNIGPPYSIVHVITRKSSPAQIKWVAKGNCPGWSETILNKDSLIQLRDKLREAKRANP